MAGVLGNTISQLKDIMNYRLYRQSVISSNIANLDTPGYNAKDACFEKELEGRLRLKTTNAKHLQKSLPDSSYKIINDPYSRIGNDSNTVDIDREMTKLMQNQLLYDASSQIVQDKIESIKNAIRSIR